MIIIIPVVINNNKWTLYKKIFDGYPVIKLQSCTAGIKNKLTLAKYDELSAKIHIFLNDLEYYHNIPNLDKMFIINIVIINKQEKIANIYIFFISTLLMDDSVLLTIDIYVSVTDFVISVIILLVAISTFKLCSTKPAVGGSEHLFTHRKGDRAIMLISSSLSRLIDDAFSRIFLIRLTD